MTITPPPSSTPTSLWPSASPWLGVRRHGLVLAGFACFLVGGSFTANSVLVDYPHAGGQAMRYGLAAVLLFALRGHVPARALRSLTVRQWVRLAALAAIGMAGFNLAVLAAERTAEPAVPGVFVGCAPVVVAVTAPLLEGRRPARAVVKGAMVVTVGAAVVQGWGRTDSAGLLWSLAALAGEVGFALIAVPLVRPLGPRLLSATACALAAVESVVLGLALDGGHWLRVPQAGEAAALLWQAVVITVVAFVCWYAAIQRIGIERATLFAGLIPVSAVLTAPVTGAGNFGTAQAVGGVLVAVGIAVGSGAFNGAAAEPRSQPRPVAGPH